MMQIVATFRNWMRLMRLLVFEGDSWDYYQEMQLINKKLFKKLCAILDDMRKGDLTSGLEETERLTFNLSHLWSKKLTDKDRIIYKFDDEYIYIYAIGGNFDRV